MTDLISREAAIAWHIARRDEAKASADRCRNEDEEAACRYLEEAILHGDAINAFRALPAQAPAVKVKPLEWIGTDTDYTAAHSGFGRYEIINTFHDSGFMIQVAGSTKAIYRPTMAEATALAQADYDSRILSAIEPAQGGEA